MSYVKSIIEMIRLDCERLGLWLDDVKQQQTDEMISKILNHPWTREHLFEEVEERNEDFSISSSNYRFLVFSYLAINHDTIDVLSIVHEKHPHLLQDELPCFLDREVSKYFENKEEFIDIYALNQESFHVLYKETKYYDKKDELWETFTTILKRDRWICYDDNEFVFQDYLNKKRLECFPLEKEDDALQPYKKSLLEGRTQIQKSQISSIVYEDNLLKMHDILKINGDFDFSEIHYEALQCLEAPQIANLTEEQITWINHMSQQITPFRSTCLTKIQAVLAKKPDYISNLKWIYWVYLSVPQILNLTEEQIDLYNQLPLTSLTTIADLFEENPNFLCDRDILKEWIDSELNGEELLWAIRNKDKLQKLKEKRPQRNVKTYIRRQLKKE